MRQAKAIQTYVYLYIYSVVRVLRILIYDHWRYFLSLVIGIALASLYPYKLVLGMAAIGLTYWYWWTFLYARASVAPKRAQNTVQNAEIFLIVALIGSLYMFWPMIVALSREPFSLYTVGRLLVNPLHLISLMIIALFFFLDSERSTDNIWCSYKRAARLIYYNMHLYIPLFLLFAAGMYSILALLGVSPFSITVLVTTIVPFIIILYSNLYLVLVRKQFDWYFPSIQRADA